MRSLLPRLLALLGISIKRKPPYEVEYSEPKDGADK